MKTFKALARQGSHHKRAKLMMNFLKEDKEIDLDEDDLADEEEGDLEQAAYNSITPAVVEQWIAEREGNIDAKTRS